MSRSMCTIEMYAMMFELLNGAYHERIPSLPQNK